MEWKAIVTAVVVVVVSAAHVCHCFSSHSHSADYMCAINLNQLNVSVSLVSTSARQMARFNVRQTRLNAKGQIALSCRMSSDVD